MTRSRNPFYALTLAETLSLSGTRLSMIAIPWLVLTTTGDPMATGTVVFAEMLPYVMAKALGGPLIDRLGARTVAIAGDLGSLLAVGLIPLLFVFNALALWSLIPVVALMGTLRGPADAAKQSLIPDVARAGDLPLERVTGVMATIERLAGAIGAAIAGTLVALIGPAPALVINAITFGASALVVGLYIAKRERPSNPAEPAESPESYLSEFATGWRFLQRDPVLIGIVIMVAATNLLDQGYASVLLPVWANESGHGAAILGLLLGIFSAAAVGGAALATGFAERLPRLTVYTIAFLIAGFPRFLIFVFDAPLWTIFATAITAGFASGFLNPILGAVIFERIPENLVGRVSSLVTALTWATLPFGGLFAGGLIAGFGLHAAFLFSGFAYLAATMLPLTMKSFRAFAIRPAKPEAGT
ncbi:MAG: MFS transporter [Hyphomicrobiaceae bacterium]|nr:MFS transporter [Hyphomicrobiaceae bacterium]MCC0024119.1 MFS transporter [Hyphomicrobiaceae bacterium]